MDGNVDLARCQGPFDSPVNNPLRPRADRAAPPFVIAACLDDLDCCVQLRPGSLQRFGHHCRLPARKLAAARSENDLLQRRPTVRKRAWRIIQNAWRQGWRRFNAFSPKTRAEIRDMLGDDLFARRHLLAPHGQGLLRDRLERVDIVKIDAIHLIHFRQTSRGTAISMMNSGRSAATTNIGARIAGVRSAPRGGR